MIPRRTAVAILAILAAAGCASRRPEPRALPRHALTAVVRPEQRRIEVTGTMPVAAVDRARSELRMALSPRLGDLTVEVLEPPISAGPAQVARVPDAGGPREAGERGNVKWIVTPTRPIPAGQPVILRFSCAGSGEAGFLYYVGPEVAFASAWGDAWYPSVDSPAGDRTVALTLHVPAGWTAATGAARQSSVQEEAQGTFRFAYPQATHASFVAGPYTIQRHEGTVPISAYLLTPRDHSATWLAGVDRMLNVLSAEFGDYPFGELTLAEVPRELATQAGFNAFSPAGMLVLNSRAFDAPDVKYLLEWLGHELGHQWFPHSVTWDPPGFLYMEEALAEYGGQRVVEGLAGPDAARRMRLSGFEYDPIYSADAYFRMVGQGVDEPLAMLGAGINQRNLAYNKGSFVFSMLSRELGREEFRRVLHELTSGRRFHTITWRAFTDAVTARAGRNLDWFFDQWLNRAGAPDLTLTWHQDGDVVRGIIAQPAPYYGARVEVGIRGAASEQATHTVEVHGPTTDFSAVPGFRAAAVELDPDYQVLRWTPEFRALADGVKQH